MELKDMLMMFMCESTLTTSVARFARDSLFDIHLVPLIHEYLRFPLFPRSMSWNLPFHFHPSSMCFHPQTNHLWITDHVAQQVAMFEIHPSLGKDIRLVDNIRCNSPALFVRISQDGLAFVVEGLLIRVGFDMINAGILVLQMDPKGNIVKLKRFGEQQLLHPSQLAIQNKLRQVAVIESHWPDVNVFSFQGIWIRKISSLVSSPSCIDWNNYLLYIGSELSHRIEVVDTLSGSSFVLKQDCDDGRFHANTRSLRPSSLDCHPGGHLVTVNKYTGDICILDMNHGTVFKQFCKNPTPAVYLAFHPHDRFNQLFVFENNWNHLSVVVADQFECVDEAQYPYHE